MCAYREDSPLKDIQIRMLVGSALYTESAIFSGMLWAVSTLEKCIEDNTVTGRYRRMYEGSVPSETICKLIQRRLKDENLILWRNHPYWALLSNNQIGSGYIENVLRCVKGRFNLDVTT